MTPFKALIFDLDGVLVDSEPLHQRSWLEAFERFGLTLSDGERELLHGRRGEQVLRLLREKRGASAPQGDWDGILAAKRALFAESMRRELRPVPGADAFLRRHKGSLRLGLVSSARLQLIGQTLMIMNWRNIFEVLVGAEHVAEPKPHPEPYGRAADRFKLDPRQCLVFEDSRVGIASAIKAGCRVCAVATSLSPRRLRLAGAHWIIRDFEDSRTLDAALAGRRPPGLAAWMRRLLP